MRKPKPRLYIRPSWCGWTGQATMAYVVTTCDPWSDGGCIVEFSVSKPAMGNKWSFRISAHAQTIRNSFFVSIARSP